MFYIITDNGDGSASAHFFKDRESAELYELFAEHTDPDGRGSLSEGVKEVGKPMTMKDVEKEIKEYNEDDYNEQKFEI